MRKKLILLSMAVILSMGIAACMPNEEVPEGIENGSEQENQQENEQENEQEAIEYELTEEGIITPESAKAIIEVIADEVIQAIADKNLEALAEFVHPAKGVRFTPYTYVSVDDDVVFSKEEIEGFFHDEAVYLWGQYDGSGEDIALTPEAYYEKFLYPVDYAEAEEIGYNEVLSSGNMLENQFEVYETPIIVEYYFSGFDQQYAGMDWRSLRLVFEEHEGAWRLVGIISNQWTI